MKAFYTVRAENESGKPNYFVYDYYLKRPICQLIMGTDKANELYADRIAKALNEMMHPEKPHERS